MEQKFTKEEQRNIKLLRRFRNTYPQGISEEKNIEEYFEGLYENLAFTAIGEYFDLDYNKGQENAFLGDIKCRDDYCEKLIDKLNLNHFNIIYSDRPEDYIDENNPVRKYFQEVINLVRNRETLDEKLPLVKDKVSKDFNNGILNENNLKDLFDLISHLTDPEYNNKITNAENVIII